MDGHIHLNAVSKTTTTITTTLRGHFGSSCHGCSNSTSQQCQTVGGEGFSVVLGTMVCPSFISRMALLVAVGPLRALTVSGSVITTFISDEKLMCECGNSIQDETIDYSVDVGLSLLAARWFSACSLFVFALSAAFCPCGSTHSFELILVWARHGCRATIWRAVLATACRCVEGCRSPNEALVC